MCTRVAGGFFYHWATWEAPRRGYYVHLLWLLLKWQFHKSRELLCLVYCRISPGPGIYIELDPYYSVKGHRRVEGRTQQRGKPKVRTGRALDLRGIPTSSIFFFFFSFSAVSLGEPQKSSFILSFECDSCQEYQSGLQFPSPGGHPKTRIEPRSLTLQANSLLSEPPEKPKNAWKIPTQ